MFWNGKLISDKHNNFTNDQNYYYVESWDELTKIKDLERIDVWLEMVILHMCDVNGDNVNWWWY